ncbi:hypothetical protein [Acetobacter indonesiensis]|uniref:hypothetical protein n=1 Tax=Acetobacter indonesiensis TaxID=104101 RepID=UPI000A3C593C|nr:hypothetical protein [Acetobacter indonesiensis]
MTDTAIYQIKKFDDGFVLVEIKKSHGSPVTQVPYSIEQEAESGVRAATNPAVFLSNGRKTAALDLVRKITRLFIQNDHLEASALLTARKSVEDLVTASIAEIRNQPECVLPEAE